MSICGRSSATEDLGLLYSDEEEDEFAVAIDMLYEKRASTRVSGLQKLVRLLTSQYQFEECTFKLETLNRLFLGAFKRGGPEESALAARALALHVTTLGLSEETEQIFNEALTVMEPAIVKGRSAEANEAAIEALSMMCFVAASGPEETMQVMSLFRKVYSGSSKGMFRIQGRAWRCVRRLSLALLAHCSLHAHTHPHTQTAITGDVQAAALRGWTLLFTTVPAWKLGTDFVEDHLKGLATLLHGDNVDVRAAAGEAVTVVYDTCELANLPVSSPAGEEEHGEENGKNEEATVDRLEDIVSRMQDLAKNRGDETRRSKKDRVVLRTTFRELSAIIEGGEIPEQKVKLRHGDVLVVDTLAANIQLNAFRSFLGEGFQVHLLSNPLLHQVFGFRPTEEPPERLTSLQKRMYRSPASAASKERSENRKSQRRASAAYKSGFLDA